MVPQWSDISDSAGHVETTGKVENKNAFFVKLSGNDLHLM